MITAICAAAVAVIGSHIGLWQTLSAYASKIAQCARCSVFWAVLVTLLYNGANIFEATMIAVLMAYATNYFALLLVLLQNFYTRLWQKLKKRR